jgi:NAD(P)H-hydrate epimerase
MLVVDGLFGSGLSRPLSGGFAAVVKYINASPASVVSLDVPSGLFCEDNSSNIASHIIRADLTLTLQFPKLAFFFQDIQQYIGEYQVLDIGLHPDGIEKAPATYFVSSIEEMQKLLKKRDKFAHKGSMGHALLVAGSYGMAGAAVLATRAALRTGLGKITVHTPKRNNDILQIAVPEAILHHDSDDYRFVHPSPTEAYQAVGIGPGLGTMKDTSVAIIEEARRTQCPIVLDADALNILGDHRSWIQQVPTHAILTPHPKEMDRLAGNSTSCYERLAKAITMANSQQFYIVLKGAWTAIVTPEGNVYFNPSGNPGMATAGSGDVLTGIILGLLAQGYTQESAARLGVYLHGLAGDLAAQDLTEEGLTAHDLIDYLPKAWKKLKGI